MNAIIRSSLAATLLGLATFALGGCVSLGLPPMPHFESIQQADSATLTGTQSGGFWGRHFTVGMMSIDGALTDGPDLTVPVYLPPGQHQVVVVSIYNLLGIRRATMFYTLDLDFQAGHHYRFTTDVDSHVTLWDDTAGADQSVSINTWVPETVESDDSGDVPMDTVDFSATEHVRPPYHPGDGHGDPHGPANGGDHHNPPAGGGDHHGPPTKPPGGPGGNHTPTPPHTGGGSSGGGGRTPPTIPQSPRPSGGSSHSSGGGGGSSSGGHSSGGSSGGSSHGSESSGGKKG